MDNPGVRTIDALGGGFGDGLGGGGGGGGRSGDGGGNEFEGDSYQGNWLLSAGGGGGVGGPYAGSDRDEGRLARLAKTAHTHAHTYTRTHVHAYTHTHTHALRSRTNTRKHTPAHTDHLFKLEWIRTSQMFRDKSQYFKSVSLLSQKQIFS